MRILLLACVGLLAVAMVASDAEAKKKRKKKAGPVVTVTQTQTVPATESGTATAACPADTTVVGGGFSSTPLDAEMLEGMVVNESRIQGNGWHASATNLGSSDPGTVSASAYCRKRTAPLVQTMASVFNCFCTPNIEVVATCPTGLKPAAGGFSGPLTFADGGAFPQMSRRFGAFAWKFVAFDQGTEPSTVTAYAYCAPKARLETSGVRVIEGTNASGTAYAPLCKRRDKKMMAGGFETAPFDILSARLQLVTASNREAGRFATTAMEAIFGPSALQSYGYCG